MPKTRFPLLERGWLVAMALVTISSWTSAPAAPAPAPTNVTIGTVSPDANALDYLYNRKPQEGSAAAVAANDRARSDDKMRALDALAGTDSPLEPPFEQYLNAAEADPAKLKAYMATYDRVIALLQSRKPADAYQTLLTMTAYEGDAGISRQLANRVQTVWDADAYARGILADNARLRDQVRSSNWNVDQYADNSERKFNDGSRQAAKNRNKNNNNTNNNNAAPAASPGVANTAASAGTFSDAADAVEGMSTTLAGKMRMTGEYLNSLDGQARIKLNEVRLIGISDKAKSEFSDYIGVLFKSGRLMHAVAATDFYRVLFQDGTLPGTIANQADAASELMRKIGQAADVIRFKINAGQLSGAGSIMREAFKLNPDHPMLQGLERPAKLKVADYYANLKKMQNLIEAREFGRLETLIDGIEKEAKDFDASKALALINAVKLDSRMHLGQAKIAAQMGEQQKALEEFRSAATAWPGNPDLQTASNGYFESQDSKNKGVAEFDRNITDGNFRAVYDSQLIYLASVKGDAEREKKFKNALEKVRDAEVATEKASLLARNNDYSGAWETLEAAARNWPDDGKLNKLRAESAIKAVDFASAVTRAQDAETRKELGYSLTLYVQAQRRYPPSQMANEAISRLSNELLGKGEATVAGAVKQ